MKRVFNTFDHFTRDRSCESCGDVVPFKNITWCGDKPYCSGKCLSEAEAVEFDTEWCETVVLETGAMTHLGNADDEAIEAAMEAACEAF